MKKVKKKAAPKKKATLTKKRTKRAEPPLWWHIHHHQLYENRCRPISERIQYIRDFKDDSEIPLRLRLLKPVRNAPADLREAARKSENSWRWRDRYEFLFLAKKYNKKMKKLHAQQCKNCPWNGRTIFTRKRKGIYV